MKPARAIYQAVLCAVMTLGAFSAAHGLTQEKLAVRKATRSCARPCLPDGGLDDRILEGDPFQVVLAEPSLGRVLIGEHLQMLRIAGLSRRVDVIQTVMTSPPSRGT
jgi:hypothetical protein